MMARQPSLVLHSRNWGEQLSQAQPCTASQYVPYPDCAICLHRAGSGSLAPSWVGVKSTLVDPSIELMIGARSATSCQTSGPTVPAMGWPEASTPPYPRGVILERTPVPGSACAGPAGFV